MFAAVQVRVPGAIFGLIFVAQFLLFLNSGPINAAIVSCVPATFRAFAMGLNTLFIHALGDALSPPLIGAVADATSLGHAVELNALPVLLGGAVLLVGAWAITARRATPAPAV
jgi:MFS transporter, Spinster family, sphingosine-1-phosphate transporter